MDTPEEPIQFKQEIMPFIRIYLSCGLKNHDLLEADEIINFLNSNDKSMQDHIKELIDLGMFNLYVCSFDSTLKVI